MGGVHFVCHVLLIETPNSGLVLVDSGLGTADYQAINSRLGWGFASGYAKPVVDPALAAITQVQALGFDPQTFDTSSRPIWTSITPADCRIFPGPLCMCMRRSEKWRWLARASRRAGATHD